MAFSKYMLLFRSLRLRLGVEKDEVRLTHIMSVACCKYTILFRSLRLRLGVEKDEVTLTHTMSMAFSKYMLLFRSLRLRLGVEKDEVTLTHINLALDEIDKIVRELFTPQLSQEPRIFVTN